MSGPESAKTVLEPTRESVDVSLPHGKTIKYIVEQYEYGPEEKMPGIQRFLSARYLGEHGWHEDLVVGDNSNVLGGGYLTKDDELEVILISGKSTQFGEDPVREWTAEKLREKYPDYLVEIE